MLVRRAGDGMSQARKKMYQGAMNHLSGLSSVFVLSPTPCPSNTYKQMANYFEYLASNLKTSPWAPFELNVHSIELI
jgi:hypothetical protein